MGTFAEDIQAAGNDPQKLAPLLFVVEKYVHLPEERFPKTVAALPALRDQYESGQIDGRWTRSTTQILKDISAMMQGRSSMLFDAYTQTIEEAFQKLGVPQKIPGLHAVQSEGYLKLVELEEEGKALEERKAGLDQRRADLEEEEKKLQQAEKQLAKRKQTLAKAEKAVKDGSASAEEIAEYKKQKSALRKRDLRIRTDRELKERKQPHFLSLWHRRSRLQRSRHQSIVLGSIKNLFPKRLNSPSCNDIMIIN